MSPNDMAPDSLSRPITIFFSAGEPSGDLHGANLIRELRRQCPGVEAIGYGGPEMAAVGCRLHADLTALAVMWIARVLVNLHKFLGLASRADRFFRHHRPDAVVLIDYPGFNWWIARRAKAHGIPVFYYAPPQIWSWASWRVKKMRRFVDHVLCALPFEQRWFAEKGCNATFVGHPFFDEVRQRRLDEAFLAEQRRRTGRLVTILPGSRTQEVQHNLRDFLRAAIQVRQAVPDVRFAVAAFKPHQAEMARCELTAAGVEADVFLGRTPELMHLAECCMACSGSVSLELLHHEKPTVILYRVSRAAHRVQGWFRRVKYITLVNLLASDELGQEGLAPGGRTADSLASGRFDAYDPDEPDVAGAPFPEYLTWEDKSGQIAAHVVRWLTDPAQRRQRVEQLVALKARVAHGGATTHATRYFLDVLAARPSIVPRPHYPPDSPATARVDDAVTSLARTT